MHGFYRCVQELLEGNESKDGRESLLGAMQNKCELQMGKREGESEKDTRSGYCRS